MRSLKSLGGRIPPGYYNYPYPDPDKTFQTLQQCYDFVAGAMRANGQPVPENLKELIQDHMCNTMPSPEFFCQENGVDMPTTVDGRKVYGTGYQGQAKWRQLHEWALTPIGRDAEWGRKRWLDAFTGSLPCGECRRKWRKLINDNPPPLYGTPEEMWKWSYERHNDVRRRLGQPLISEEEARALYEVTA